MDNGTMFMGSGAAGVGVYFVLASLSNVHEKLISTPLEAGKLGGAICAGLLVFSAGLQTMHLGAIEYIPAAILMLIISYPIGFGAGFMLWSILPESSRKTLADFFLITPAPQPTKSSLSAVHWIGILIVLPLSAFGIMFIAMYSHDKTREKTQSVQPPTVAPQQPSPPLQTNSDSGLPPCIGTKVATWTNCTGALSFPDGYKYDGEWREGNPNGQGTSTSPDGVKYVGDYRDGKMHGQGTQTRSDGSVIHSGLWADDKPVK